MRAPIRYARSGDVNIAYEVTGGGDRDLCFVPGFVSHLELTIPAGLTIDEYRRARPRPQPWWRRALGRAN